MSRDEDPFADESNEIANAWQKRVVDNSLSVKDNGPKRAPPARAPFSFDTMEQKIESVSLVDLPGISNQDHRASLEDWQSWCLKPRTHYLDWGSPLMNEALLGAQAGTSILIAGMPNHGKSQLLTSTVLNLLEANDDVVVLDLSLDDSRIKRYTQYTATMARIEMNAVDYAHNITDQSELRRYDAGVDKLRQWIANDHLIIHENTTLRRAGHTPVHTASIGFIRSEAERIRGLYPDRKLVITLDSLNNVIVRPDITDDYVTARLVSDEIETLLNETGALLLASSHLRKNQGKRPELDDLKGNNALAYAAKVVIGIYNEVKARRAEATCCWFDSLNPGFAMPVVEAHFLKSKVSAYNGCICFQQWPAWGKVMEAEPLLQGTLLGMTYGRK